MSPAERIEEHWQEYLRLSKEVKQLLKELEGKLKSKRTIFN